MYYLLASQRLKIKGSLHLVYDRRLNTEVSISRVTPYIRCIFIEEMALVQVMGDAYKWIVFSRAFKITLNKWPLKKDNKAETWNLA